MAYSRNDRGTGDEARSRLRQAQSSGARQQTQTQAGDVRRQQTQTPNARAGQAAQPYVRQQAQASSSRQQRIARPSGAQTSQARGGQTRANQAQGYVQQSYRTSRGQHQRLSQQSVYNQGRTSSGRSQQKQSRIITVVIAVLMALVVVAGIFIASRVFTGQPILPSSQTIGLPAADPAGKYESPYNWQNLDRTGGRYVFRIDGQVMSRLGIDVSENQQDIDWNQVANDGIEFAIIRLGYRGTSTGAIRLDERYYEYLEGAQLAGLDCGVYFFSQATSVQEAQEEADFVLQNLQGTTLEYPVVYDCEEVAAGAGTSRTTGMSKDEMTACARAFCERIEAAGYRAMVYGNTRDLARYHVNNLKPYPLWYAEYGMPTPTVAVDFTMWQYSNSGQVAGISTAVDLDIDLSEAYRASGR